MLIWPYSVRNGKKLYYLIVTSNFLNKSYVPSWKVLLHRLSSPLFPEANVSEIAILVELCFLTYSIVYFYFAGDQLQPCHANQIRCRHSF